MGTGVPIYYEAGDGDTGGKATLRGGDGNNGNGGDLELDAGGSRRGGTGGAVTIGSRARAVTIAPQLTLGAGLRYGADGPTDTSGAGSPEGVVTAPVGSSYRDTSSGSLYMKTSGAGNTGWTQLGTSTAVLTEWESWTPVASWTSNVSAVFGRRRWVGDTIELQVFLSVSGAPSPSTSLYFDFPSGVTLTASKTVFGESSRAPVLSRVTYRDNGTADYNNGAVRVDVTNSRIYPYDNNGAEFTPTAPFTWASGDLVWLQCAFAATES